MVGLGGLEPPTSRLSSARSNQLSYKPSDRTFDRLASETKSRKADRPSRLVPRPRGAPAAESCGTARERRSKSLVKKEKRRRQIRFCMCDVKIDYLPSCSKRTERQRLIK